jgi:hypothetical protein
MAGCGREHLDAVFGDAAIDFAQRTVPALPAGEIDDHGPGLHALDGVLGQQQGSGTAGNERGGDDDVGGLARSAMSAA